MTQNRPEEVIVLHKGTFIACIQALGIYLGNTFDYLSKIQNAELNNESKTLLLEILKSDLEIIGNIGNALESSMDYKREVDLKNNRLN